MKTIFLATESLVGRIVTTPAEEPKPTAEAEKPAGFYVAKYLTGRGIPLSAACEGAGLTVAEYERANGAASAESDNLSGIVAYYERQGLTNAQAKRAAGMEP